MGNTVSACCRLFTGLILRRQPGGLSDDRLPLLSDSRRECCVAPPGFTFPVKTESGASEERPVQGYPDIVLSSAITSNSEPKSERSPRLDSVASKTGAPDSIERDWALSDQKDGCLNSVMCPAALKRASPTSDDLPSALEEITKQVKDHGCQPVVWHVCGQSEDPDCCTDNRLCCEETPMEIADITDVGGKNIGLESSSELVSHGQECDFVQLARKGGERFKFRTEAPENHSNTESVTKGHCGHLIRDPCTLHQRPTELLMAATVDPCPECAQAVGKQVCLAPARSVDSWKGQGKLPNRGASGTPPASQPPSSSANLVTPEDNGVLSGLGLRDSLRKKRKKKRLLRSLTVGCEEAHSSDMPLVNGDAGHDHSETENHKERVDDETRVDDGNEQEVIVIQDTGFTVKMHAPGIEPFDLQVSPQEMVQEIHQVLMDREDTCHRTCFSLQLDGNVLDNFSELKSIEGLQEGSNLKVVEEPYTVREARIHVRHIRDLLKSLDPSDSYNGVDCNSLSFLSMFTEGDLGETGKRKRKGSELEQIDCTPPEHILPGSKERPLLFLQPQTKEAKPLQCLKVLTMSGWNPPPGNRKMHGDLMYLYVVTMEDRHVSITASTRGFYVNHSTAYIFNPKPANPSFLSHSLVELLSQTSPIFKKNFAALQKKRVQRHPFERIATPFQVYSWTAPMMEHAMDCVRAEDAYTSRLGYEEHIPGQTRDWNEELQTTRELPRKNLPERLLRERAIFKVHSDFAAAATRGAMAVIDGNVMAINPGEETKMQMFIWNNIFFSLGFDVRDHYKDFGGDNAAYVAPTNDLNGVRAYNAVDVEGLYTLGTVVVDYRGYRVTAQSIIPGILEREQEQSVIYGSIDFGKTVVSHTKYLELLEKTARPLKIQKHNVLSDKNDEVELCSSVECKGIIGNDSRHYILDLLRTFPPDLNFLPVEGEELPEECSKMGFPKEHRHRLSCLRQELIEAFVEHRYLVFMKLAALQLMQQKANRQEKDCAAVTENGSSCLTGAVENNKTVLEDVDPKSKEVILNAYKAVGSISNTSFDIRFNPDIFSPGVRFHDPDCEELQKQKQLLKDAAAFLVSCQIPSLIKDCVDHTVLPMDGATLAEAIHQRGINIRYLAKVVQLVSKSLARQQLDHIHKLGVTELITRSVKHIFKIYLQGVELSGLSVAISHFLNCFLSSFPNPVAHLPTDELVSKKKRNKRKPRHLGNADNTAWASMTPQELWRSIGNEAKSYFSFSIDCESVDQAVEKYGLQKISLLREICVKSGIQILLKEYNFDSRHRPTFTEEDILNIFPVVKHVNPKASDAFHFFQSGQAKVQQGFLKEGCELINEALNLFNNVYGAMHVEICACLRLLARLNYIMGDYNEALSNQQKAVLMSERALGVDHPNTIQEYMHLALYCFANGQLSTALKLLYRSRYLLLLVYGEDHPEMALLDSNIGLVLHGVMEYDLALRFLESALAINGKYHGVKSLKVALSHHLVARVYESKAEFRSALQHEKDGYTIYKNQLGDNHEKTKESSEYLKYLTQQAVALQRTMNEIYRNGSSTSILPLKFTASPMAGVLEQLNVINGILFIPLSQKDLENLKAEVQRRQQLQEAVKSVEQGETTEEKVTAPHHREKSQTTVESSTEQASA
ncbi:clustered mitochondria protein homolog isoform X2 [Scyliorhinus torazame]|uniref:clustered mitochondria protein homolog isoform X2 n=1 Tax=Scyliorhinus torazame TaxID=75743 RepID=UPI003B59BAC5